MKRLVAIFLACSLVFTGCASSSTQPTNTEVTSSENIESSNVESAVEDNTSVEEVGVEAAERDIEEIKEFEPDADTTPYEYEVDFAGLDDEELQKYVEDNLYNEIVSQLDSEDYLVENVSTVYISQEYIDELAYNSKANVYFGYNLEELDNAFQGTRYVFTLGDNGETVVTAFEDYDDTYEQVIKNVAIGTGVILVCVTVSVVTAGTGTAPAVTMIFATAAKTGTIMALSSGTIGGVATGVVTGIQTGDMDKAVKAGMLAGSEEFKWGAIVGCISGGLGETFALGQATKNGLTMNQAAAIQRESGYPLEVIKQFHTTEEYQVFKDAGLKNVMINGKAALVRGDINLSQLDANGFTNLQRMQSGLDINGNPFELHHIGQNADGALAILTVEEHDNAVLHGFKAISEIDRKAFAKQRKRFWKTMAKLLEAGEII